MKSNIGILLTNIGSPDQPTTRSVRHYLKKFLTDPRVVEIPKFLWLPILHGFILRTRPTQSAKLYQKIWTEQGSPLIATSKKIAEQLSEQLQLPVVIGMHYGNPSIPTALEELKNQGIQKILIFPQYPQYSATTTAATFDQVAKTLKKWRNIPDIRFIHDYHNHPDYITAICHSIQQQPIQHLLFSFHGIPQRCIDRGDPYAKQCLQTVELVTQQLNLSTKQYSVSFQSRLGRAKWLTPYTEEKLKQFPQQHIKDIQVICPGFAVDCLETLEEIAIRGKNQFLATGGHSFQYIHALNNSPEHINTLKKIITTHIEAW